MHAKVAKSTQIYYFQSLPDGLVGLLVRLAGGNLQVLPHPGHLHFLPLILRAFPVSTLPASAPHQHTGWVPRRIDKAPWLPRAVGQSLPFAAPAAWLHWIFLSAPVKQGEPSGDACFLLTSRG